MNCQVCTKKPATVHIIEILEMSMEAGKPHELEEKVVCVDCAQLMNLPYAQATTEKKVVNIWKLLQQSARKSREEGGLTCPDCGMTLAEFRNKGRLGCPRDYEVFREYLDPLLRRIHNATEHRGRRPGLDDQELDRMQAISALRQKLEAAIREEAYEDAAELRDELQALEGEPPS